MEGDEAVHLVVDELRRLLVLASEEGIGQGVPSRARIPVDDPDDEVGVDASPFANWVAGNDVTERDLNCGLLLDESDAHFSHSLAPQALSLLIAHLATDCEGWVTFPLRTGDDEVSSHRALADVVVVQLQLLYLGLQVGD